MLPAPSVAVQIIVVVPNGKAVGALLVTVGAPQLSLLVGVPKTTPVAVQPVFVVAETLAGAVILGKILSVTVTTCTAVLVFPEPSVTVQTTFVAPGGKVVGALFVTEATVQLSAVVGVPKTTPAALQPEFGAIFILAGAVIVGNTLSTTVTIWLAVFVLPEASVTVQIIVVAPNGKIVRALLVTVFKGGLWITELFPKTTDVAVQLVFVPGLIFAGAVKFLIVNTKPVEVYSEFQTKLLGKTGKFIVVNVPVLEP
jgi:hypothetical protein